MTTDPLIIVTLQIRARSTSGASAKDRRNDVERYFTTEANKSDLRWNTTTLDIVAYHVGLYGSIET